MASDKAGGELIAAAAEWLVALDAGRADPQSFEAWRAADPRHAAAFAQMLAIWEKTGALRLSPERPEMPVSEPVSDDVSEKQKATAPVFSRRRLLAGAGAGVFLAAAGTAVVLSGQWQQRLRTDVGERRAVRLPDGSSAELNTDTILSWDFDDSRSVWLERGEAAITVATNSALPFLLHSADVVARLTEGRYNLRLWDNGPELIALSGSGEIHSRNNTPVVLAPMHAVLRRNGRIQTLEVSADDADAAQAWRRGEIVFNGMRLDEAVREFNRYLEKKLVVADPRIGAIRLQGRFFVDDLASFLRSLKHGFEISADVRAHAIILRSA